jgi:hypothetical protein
MEKISLKFNTPKHGEVTIKLGRKLTVLTERDYRKYIDPSPIPDNKQDRFWTYVRKNVENYFKSLEDSK